MKVQLDELIVNLVISQNLCLLRLNAFVNKIYFLLYGISICTYVSQESFLHKRIGHIEEKFEKQWFIWCFVKRGKKKKKGK